MARPPLSNRKKNLTTCVVTYKHIMVMLMEIIAELVQLIAILNVNIPTQIPVCLIIVLEKDYWLDI